MTAACVSLEQESDFAFVGDIRQVWPEALHKFLYHVCTDLFYPKNKAYKDAVMLMFRNMYVAYRKYLMDSFFGRINYDEKVGKQLYKHQQAALVLMLPHKYNFLSFDMGLGKTITSATLSKILGIRRTIIIAPAGVKWNWYHDMTDDWGYDPLYWTILDAKRNKCIYGFAERFVVVNYEMISKPWVWQHLTKNEVGHIIIDECFPYYTPVLTDKGELFIGDIVENAIDCSVLSCDLSSNELSFQKIEAYRGQKRKTEYVKIKHEKGELICTRNHKIYVEEVGFKRADQLLDGDRVRILQEGKLKEIQRKKNCKILFKKMLNGITLKRRRMEKKAFSRASEGSSKKNKDLRVVQSKIRNNSVFKNQILFIKLFCKMEDESTGDKKINNGSANVREKVRGNQAFTQKESKYGKRIFRKNEEKKSNVKPRDSKKGERSIKRKNIFISWRQRKANKATTGVTQRNWFANGTRNKHKRCKSEFQKFAESLQSGSCSYWKQNSNRSGWKFPQNEEMEISGQTENRSFECVRVESVEILERRSGQRVDEVCGTDKVYNIQVAKNKNYFARGVLVSNCHLAKNHKTRRYGNVSRLVERFPKARVTMLSGTPITNRINDMFAYFKLTGHALGNNESYFKRRYLERSNGEKGKIIGAKNIPELTVRNSNFMIRKKAEECLDLPPLIINKYYLEDTEITDEYREVLEDMYKTKMALSETGDAKTVGQLEMQMDSNVHSLNRILATAKAKSIIELVDKIRSEGRKVIVFATYKSALAALEEHYKHHCVKIVGDVDSHKRHVLIEKFKNDPECFLFLGNVKAGGVGTNLVNSSDVIFMNFPFTPDDIEQPQKRSHRIGQTKPVNVYYTIVKNSIDEHIYKLIVDKSNDINYVLDKGKKGVVNYGSVTSKLFRSLINQYAEDNNLRKIEESEFEEV